jgi:glutathione peroxidase
MGFPSNDFGNQEPGSNEQIADFCTANYGVKFPMFAKVKVHGGEKIPLYQALTSGKEGVVRSGEIGWNFEKFLIGRDGQLVARFYTSQDPKSGDVVAPIRAALGRL